MTPIVWGVLAAVSWGFADYFAALMSRRTGTFRTLFGSQWTSVGLLAVALALTGNLPPLGVDALLAALALGAIGAAALGALYEGLALGPVAIVSPVVAAFAAITVLLAVALLGETLGPLQVAAIVVTIVGVMLASTDLRVVRETLGRPSRAIALGLGAMLAFGVLEFALAVYARAFGVTTMLLVPRAATLLAIFLFGLARRRPLGGLAVPTLAAVAVVGLLDLAGLLAFGVGVRSGYASLVAVGSTAYPLIPFALGVSLLRERVAPNQYAGVGLLVSGLVVLAAA